MNLIDKPHELIDQDEPRCLYCNREVNVNLSSQWLPGTSLRLDIETLTCRKCRESFWIHSLQGDDGHTKIDGFTFSCEDFWVFYNYVEGYFDVKDKNRKFLFAIPAFPLDFSDKNKLYEKLKTYLVFS
jgi:hypothetical protein